jgi:carbon storage regulator
MLVLTRKIGEAVQIGEIVVMVVADQGGQVRLGIEAPREMNIVRTELLPTEQQAQLHRRCGLRLKRRACSEA